MTTLLIDQAVEILLYICTVKTSIVPLRRDGKKLPKEQFKHYQGRLQMMMGVRNVFVAHLINLEDGISEVLPNLFDAKLLKIEARGMLIAGIEQVQRGKKGVEKYPQTWWCTEWIPPGAVPFSPGYDEYMRYLALHLPWLETQRIKR